MFYVYILQSIEDPEIFYTDLLKILNVVLKNIILQEIRDGQKIENGKLCILKHI